MLEVGHNNALGTSAGGTTVANQAALEFKSASPLNVPELNFTVSGDGWNNSGTGVLNSISPANVTLAGAVSVPGASYLGTTTFGNHSAGTTLALQGNVTITAAPVANLVFNGAGDISVAGVIALPGTYVNAPYFSSFQGRLFMGVLRNRQHEHQQSGSRRRDGAGRHGSPERALWISHRIRTPGSPRSSAAPTRGPRISPSSSSVR